MQVLREAGSEVERLLGELRCGDTYKRGVAAGQFNDLLIQWGRDEPTPARRAAMEVRGAATGVCYGGGGGGGGGGLQGKCCN